MGIFFHNPTATSDIYTLSLHDALPIYATCLKNPMTVKHQPPGLPGERMLEAAGWRTRLLVLGGGFRSDEHTPEIESRFVTVCGRLRGMKLDTKSSVVGIGVSDLKSQGL